MKLYLKGHSYKYAVEQMMLTLFPGERPEYPQENPFEADDWESMERILTAEGGVLSSLHCTETLATASTRLVRQGKDITCECIGQLAPDMTPLLRDRLLQHILKQAFFRCFVDLTGERPAWGALTGVRPAKLPVRAVKAGATLAEAQRELEEVYHVSNQRARLTMDCARASLAVSEHLRPDEISLYIGIPFCPSRCSYCSFISADVNRSLKLMEPYVNALIREILSTGRILDRDGLHIKTLYVGGGTPTSLSADTLDTLLTVMQDHLPLSRCEEITVEAGRPDTITREKLMVLREHGVQRISINPQTMHDEILANIGRNHSVQMVLDAYKMAREIGFACTNMDLIAGLPGDTLTSFSETLKQVIDLDPENITIHTLARKKGARLTVEMGTVSQRGEVPEMLEFSLKTLPTAGYQPYYLYRQKYMSGAMENVGWCKPGTANIYNICMMEELHSVISLGAGGITKLVDSAKGRIVRLSNPKYPHDYLAALENVLRQKEEITAFFTEETGM